MKNSITDINKKTILIVDDAAENIDVLSGLLSPLYNIKAASNGRNALKIALSGIKIDLILLDVIMPDMNGFKVCAELKSDIITKNIPVIFISSKDEIHDKLDGYDAGGSNYISKPIDPVFTLKTIKSIIG
jgi:putative two-component system response regulator